MTFYPGSLSINGNISREKKKKIGQRQYYYFAFQLKYLPAIQYTLIIIDKNRNFLSVSLFKTVMGGGVRLWPWSI